MLAVSETLQIQNEPKQTFTGRVRRGTQVPVHPLLLQGETKGHAKKPSQTQTQSILVLNFLRLKTSWFDRFFFYSTSVSIDGGGTVRVRTVRFVLQKQKTLKKSHCLRMRRGTTFRLSGLSKKIQTPQTLKSTFDNQSVSTNSFVPEKWQPIK